MIENFKCSGTEDLFEGRDTKASRRICPSSLRRVALRKLEYLDSAAALEDLRVPHGNMLEMLKGNRVGQHSIRINSQFRICFVWTEQGPTDVEIVDYH
jgi:proteic killer suppression protein